MSHFLRNTNGERLMNAIAGKQIGFAEAQRLLESLDGPTWVETPQGIVMAVISEGVPPNLWPVRLEGKGVDVTFARQIFKEDRFTPTDKVISSLFIYRGRDLDPSQQRTRAGYEQHAVANGCRSPWYEEMCLVVDTLTATDMVKMEIRHLVFDIDQKHGDCSVLSLVNGGLILTTHLTITPTCLWPGDDVGFVFTRESSRDEQN